MLFISAMLRSRYLFIMLLVLLLVGVAYYVAYPMRGVDIRTGGKVLYGDQLFILSPKRGDNWNLSGRYDILWDSSSIDDGFVLKLILEGPASGVISIIDGDQVRDGRLSWSVRGILNRGNTVRIVPGQYYLVGEVYDGEICAEQAKCSIDDENEGKLVASYKSGKFTISE